MPRGPIYSSQEMQTRPAGIGAFVAHFSTELTGTTIQTVVAAITSTRIRVRAFNINSMVSVVLAAASGPSIALVDSTYATGVLYHLFCYAKTAAITTVPLSTGLVVIPGDGALVQTTAGNALKIAQSVDLSTGVVAVSGSVWYDKVA